MDRSEQVFFIFKFLSIDLSFVAYYNDIMYNKVLHFVKYNNAFTLLLALFFFGFGISFAAEPTLRDGIYSSQQTVVSVDNNWIVSVDLDAYNFNLKINSITEDDKNYYASYSYQTIAVQNSAWQNQQISKVLTVSKDELDGKDLGLYVAKELGENINYELSYLKQVQKQEKEKGESQKVITTEYSGLIGKFLNPKEEVIDGYKPVIPEVVPEIPATVESNPQDVVVSIKHTEQQTVPEQIPEQTTIEQTTPQPTPEQTTIEQTTPQPTPEQTTIEQTTPQPTPEQTPAPESAVDTGLVQKVVGALLDNQTKEPAVTDTTTATTPTNSITPATVAPNADTPTPATDATQ